MLINHYFRLINASLSRTNIDIIMVVTVFVFNFVLPRWLGAPYTVTFN